MDGKHIRAKVYQVLSEASGINLWGINDEMRLEADLRIGQTIGNGEFLELKEALERALDVEIPPQRLPREDELASLRVSDVVELMHELVAAPLFHQVPQA